MTLQFRLRFVLCVTVVLALPMSTPAQLKQIIEGPDKPWTYEYTVDPAAELQPALKYRLLPARLDQQPGNAATSYYRAIQSFGAHSEQDRKDLEACFNFGLMIRPPSTNATEPVSIEQIRKSLATFEDVLTELQTATMRDHCDWGIGYQEKDGTQTIALRFNEFGITRSLARLVHLKARSAIVDQNYDEALRIIQIGFQLGRNIAQCPFIIAGLYGNAISIETQVLLAEIVVQPGAPNLYWAIATVPRPFINVKPAIENELNLVLKYPFVREAERMHSPEEWKRLLKDVFHTLQALDGTKPQAAAEDDSQDRTLELIRPEFGRAKSELLSFGIAADRVATLQMIQVVALHEMLLVRQKRDEILKLIYLPFPQAVPLLDRIENPADDPTESKHLASLKEIVPLFARLRPEFRRPLDATVRLDRLLVRSQVVEALRMHAAANHHKLPASLSDLTLVPIPADPITGQPIKYHLDGETAVMEFPGPNSKLITESEITRVTVRRSK